MKREIQSLYVLKALSAFFVVLIHFPLSCQALITPVIRTAVPVFFIISGYFLVASDGSISKDKVKRGIVKMIKYVLLYNCLFVVFNYLFYGYATVYDELKWLLATAVLASPFGYHLWYLTAYLQVLIYLYVAMYIKRKFMFQVAPFFVFSWRSFDGLARNFYSFRPKFYVLGNSMCIGRNISATAWVGDYELVYIEKVESIVSRFFLDISRVCATSRGFHKLWRLRSIDSPIFLYLVPLKINIIII